MGQIWPVGHSLSTLLKVIFSVWKHGSHASKLSWLMKADPVTYL